MANNNTLNVAIIGLGHLHPRAYMPLFENHPALQVVAASDSNETLLRSFCQDFGLSAHTDYGQMLSAEAIDIAAVFLPHDECGQAAIACAERGIHLLVEKPITATVAQTREVAEAVQAHKVKITTGYCWRFHPVIKKMKECIEEGLIGDIVSVEARLAAGRVERYINGQAEWMLQKAKVGGGPMYNLGVHWIDTLCHVLNDNIASVSAVNTQTNDAYDIEDSSIAMLRFAAGPVGTLSTSYIVPDCFPCGRDLFLGIKGTRGVLSYAPGYEGEQGSGAAGQTDVLDLYSDSEKIAGASVRRFVFQLDKVAGYSGYMGKAYLADFVAAIQNNTEPAITIEQAIDVLKVVEAIYESDRTGAWVNV